MGDQIRVHFPRVSSKDSLQAPGVMEDMHAPDGVVDDALLTDRAPPPVLFGAGGFMYVHFPSWSKSGCMMLCAQVEAV
jgi:6-phosphofructo-2-kinase/fructose-2,6-biphosphatase 2